MAKAKASEFKPGLLGQFRSGDGVYNYASCPADVSVRWVVRRRSLPTHSVGSNAGGGGGVNVGGIGSNGRLYERNVYARRSAGNPPADVGGLTSEYKDACALPWV